MKTGNYLKLDELRKGMVRLGRVTVVRLNGDMTGSQIFVLGSRAGTSAR